MSISFQTNVASMIAEVNLNNNNTFQKSTITQLTSGYRINNSGDDAAGLAVANGYAASVAELQQGILNGNQGVNTLQIIDGGLSNISTMLNRMQTLATESATTTFTGNRATLNAEYQTLVGEINREASNVGLSSTNSTNAAKISVFIGGGQSANTGSQVNVDLSSGRVDASALNLTGTGVSGASPVTIGNTAAVAIADGATETFTISTAAGTSAFTITGKSGDTVATQLAALNNDLGTVGVSASLDSNSYLALSSAGAFSAKVTTAGLAQTGATTVNTSMYNATMTFVKADTGPTYTVSEGTKTATISDTGVGNTGSLLNMTDSQALANINAQLQAQGITDVTAVADGSGTAGHFSLQGSSSFTVTAGALSAGVMSGTASTTTAPLGGLGSNGALDAVNAVTAAVQLLGKVQGTVGAGENDLNYAIGLANSQITNFSATESSIRDADVATEAANLTKAQVLEQASVAAMAQANSAPQAILSLLKG